MSASKEKGSEAAATASKPMIAALGKPTLVHSAPIQSVATPPAEESENSLLNQAFFECRKAGGYTVRAQFETFGGTTYLDIRQWSGSGMEAIRTRKGATIPLERVRELGEALCRAHLPDGSGGAQNAS